MHDCYLCGQACYCHGDIDDCPVKTVEYAYAHCEGCGGDECLGPDDDGGFDDEGVHDHIAGELDDEIETDLRHDEWAWLRAPR